MRIIINYPTISDLLQQILIIIMNIEFFRYISISEYNYTSKKISKSDMNPTKICLNCGSSDLVSDRSLGGKMVCFKCGSSSFRNKSFSPISNKMFFYFFIALIIILIVVI